MGLLAGTTNTDQYLGQSNRFLGSPPADARTLGLVMLEPEKGFARGLRRRDPSFSVAQAKIPFQYIERVPVWQKAANWTDVSGIVGRFEQLSVYSNSSAQDFAMELIYHAEASEDARLTRSNTRSIWTLEYIETLTRRLKSTVFPQYDGRYNPPKKFKLYIGKIYPGVPVIIKNVSVEDTGPTDRHFWSHTRKITLEFRTAYPLWQSISQPGMWYVETNTANNSNKTLLVTAHKSFNDLDVVNGLT